MKIKITISKNCTDAGNCEKCLQVCPEGVFLLVPHGKYVPEKLKDVETLKYSVAPRFKENCTACLLCVEACPVGAITIKNS
ncbi:MAG: 4Fe-4S dicluster domain-containing protein [Candidatus Helarchaeota archaeon]